MPAKPLHATRSDHALRTGDRAGRHAVASNRQLLSIRSLPAVRDEKVSTRISRGANVPDIESLLRASAHAVETPAKGDHMYATLKAFFAGLTVAAVVTVLIPALLWDVAYEPPTESELTSALNIDSSNFDVQRTSQGSTYAAPAGFVDPAWTRYVVGLEDVSLKSTTITLEEPLSRSAFMEEMTENGWVHHSGVDKKIYIKDGLRLTIDLYSKTDAVSATRVSPLWLAPASFLIGALLGIWTFFLTRKRFTNLRPGVATIVGASLVMPTLIWQLCTSCYEAFAVEEAVRGLHHYAYPLEAFVVSALWKVGAMILIAEAIRTRFRTDTRSTVPR